MMQKRLTVALVACFLFVGCLFSQHDELPPSVVSVNRATLLGIGSASLIDTYLSPLRYNGTSMALLYEQIGASTLFDNRMLLQHQFQVEVATTTNPSETSSEYHGNISYNLNGFYPLLKTDDFRLYAGPGIDLEIGGIYNVRNSNNPGSLKTQGNLSLPIMAMYNWRKFVFRWQLTTALAGVFFSPEYGQSYYEIFSLGNDEGTVNFGSLHNQQSFKNYLTVDYPVGNFTIRGGYLGNYYRTNVNGITTKIVSHRFMVGLAVESLNFGGKKIENNKWINSVYY